MYAAFLPETLARSWRLVALGTLLTIMNTVIFYMLTAYTPTFGGAVLHLAARDNLMVTLCVGASNFLWLPIMGAFRQNWAAPNAGIFQCAGAADGLSGIVVAGRRAVIQPSDGGGIVVLILVRQLQRRADRLPDGNHANRRPHCRICSCPRVRPATFCTSIVTSSTCLGSPGANQTGDDIMPWH